MRPVFGQEPACGGNTAPLFEKSCLKVTTERMSNLGESDSKNNLKTAAKPNGGQPSPMLAFESQDECSNRQDRKHRRKNPCLNLICIAKIDTAQQFSHAFSELRAGMRRVTVAQYGWQILSHS